VRFHTKKKITSEINPKITKRKNWVTKIQEPEVENSDKPKIKLKGMISRRKLQLKIVKWIQFTTDQIDSHKRKLASYDISKPFEKEEAKICSQVLKKEELRLTKLIKFYCTIGNKKYCKVCYATKKGLNIGCIYAQGPCM